MTGLPAADGNGNGVIDAADYTVWRDNLGAAIFPANAGLSLAVESSGDGSNSTDAPSDSATTRGIVFMQLVIAGSEPNILAAPSTRAARLQSQPNELAADIWFEQIGTDATSKNIRPAVRTGSPFDGKSEVSDTWDPFAFDLADNDHGDSLLAGKLRRLFGKR